MKRRTFYIINLDRNRIFILTVLFVGLLAVAYATGFRLGRSEGPAAGVEALSYQDLMGLPGETRPGELAPGDLPPGDLSELPDEHPLREDTPGIDPLGAPAMNPNALADQPNAAPRALPRLTEPRAPARQQPTRTERRKEEERRPVATPTPRPPKKPTAKKQPKPRPRTNPPRERTVREQPLASNPQRRSTIGQSVRPGDRQSFQNTPRSRLSFQKAPEKKSPRETNAGDRKRSPEKPRKKTEPVAAKKPGKNTVSLRNVSPAADPHNSAQRRTERPAKKNREYSLQLGSFSERDSAFRMASSLKRQGFTPYVYKSGGKFAVRVGKTDHPEYLETLEQRLRRKRYSPMRISYKKK